jgi:hypothetical protein
MTDLKILPDLSGSKSQQTPPSLQDSWMYYE